MKLFLIRFSAFLISLTLFLVVIYFVTPPKSFIEASYFQILIFFIPLLLTVTFFINIFLRYLPHSLIVGLGFLVLTSLWATHFFDYLTVALTLLVTFISLRLFPKIKYKRIKLTKIDKIPKLTPK